MTPLVVLVRTHSPGNLGACARACRCFGAELLLVDPRAPRDHADARAFASGAEDLLDAAELLPGLEALRGRAERVLALTAGRGRAARGLPPELSLAELAREPGRVALVFGPERGGLTSLELKVCDGLVTLSTRPEFPTLSLPQAVAASLALAADRPPVARADDAASSGEMAGLFAVLREALGAAGWPRAGRSPESVDEVESLLKRARPTRREVSLLRGALAALVKPR